MLIRSNCDLWLCVPWLVRSFRNTRTLYPRRLCGTPPQCLSRLLLLEESPVLAQKTSSIIQAVLDTIHYPIINTAFTLSLALISWSKLSIRVQELIMMLKEILQSQIRNRVINLARLRKCRKKSVFQNNRESTYIPVKLLQINELEFVNSVKDASDDFSLIKEVICMLKFLCWYLFSHVWVPRICSIESKLCSDTILLIITS